MEDFLNALSGLGLFLLGMIIMTEGLRSLAGDKIRSSLMKFTHSPSSGALSGAISTAILQSSSATTVAAVGFVGAGLLTFQQSLGIIFGANIGTTITGWLVALLGFKLQLGMIVLPLVFIGAVMHLFGKEKVKKIGLALAGFSLIFVGIDMLQDGMQALQHLFSFDRFPADTFIGRLQLVLFGMLFTIITQSSSAGVAAALAALFANMISFEQAAALVIGMDIGTTVTALMATIGARSGAKRTGYSHVIYNFMTGTIALLIITPYSLLVEKLSPGFLVENAEISLVAFHTLFNTLGVIIILPFTNRFARFIERIVPETKTHYTQNLDMALLNTPETALHNVQESIQLEVKDLLNYTVCLLDNKKSMNLFDIKSFKETLTETQRYLDLIEIENTKKEWHTIINLIHVMDHLLRLQERCEEDQERAFAATKSKQLKPLIDLLINSVLQAQSLIENNQWQEAKALTQQAKKEIHDFAQPYRHNIVEEMGNNKLSIPKGTRQLEAIRWLRRVSTHLNEIVNYLSHINRD